MHARRAWSAKPRRYQSPQRRLVPLFVRTAEQYADGGRRDALLAAFEPQVLGGGGLHAHVLHRDAHGGGQILAPLLDPDLSRQPRTLVISAEYCPLRDEGEAYAARLELEGDQEVQCYRMLDAVHGYLLYPSVLSLVKDTYRIIKHFLDGDDLTQEGEPAWLGILGTD